MSPSTPVSLLNAAKALPVISALTLVAICAYSRSSFSDKATLSIFSDSDYPLNESGLNIKGSSRKLWALSRFIASLSTANSSLTSYTGGFLFPSWSRLFTLDHWHMVRDLSDEHEKALSSTSLSRLLGVGYSSSCNVCCLTCLCRFSFIFDFVEL